MKTTLAVLFSLGLSSFAFAQGGHPADAVGKFQCVASGWSTNTMPTPGCGPGNPGGCGPTGPSRRYFYSDYFVNRSDAERDAMKQCDQAVAVSSCVLDSCKKITRPRAQ